MFGWVFFVVGGFLLGAIAQLGWIMTGRYPRERGPFAVIAVGIVCCVEATTWAVALYEGRTWFKLLTLAGWVTITAGLAWLTAARLARPD